MKAMLLQVVERKPLVGIRASISQMNRLILLLAHLGKEEHTAQ